MVKDAAYILRKLLIILLCLAVFKDTGAQFVEVRTSLDTNQVLIGDQFNLLIIISQPAGIRVSYPEYTDTIIEGIEILERFTPDTIPADNDQIEITRRYLLTSFDSGIYVLPPMTFHLSADEWSDSITSNPIYLAVYTLPLDSAGRIFDIKAPLGSPLNISEIWPYIIGGLLIIVLAISLILYLRKRRGKRPILAYNRPADPPYIIALRELDSLSEEKLWQHGHIKQYYTRLTEIIRSYLENQFAIPAMEMTSDETLDQWKRRGNNPGLSTDLKELLSLADLVKFAKEKPLPSFNELNLARAYDFVKKTRPIADTINQQDKPVNGTVIMAGSYTEPGDLVTHPSDNQQDEKHTV